MGHLLSEDAPQAASPYAVKAFPKIAALEKVAAFFEGEDITITEKLDGSNVALRSIDGELVLQSRTTIIDQAKPAMFAHFVEWAQAWYTPERAEIMERNATIFYGEMLGNGKIKYNERLPFVLFAVRKDDGEGTYYVNHMLYGQKFDIPYVTPLYKGEWQGVEHVKSFIGQSAYADREMEGVVVSAFDVRCYYEVEGEDGAPVKRTYQEPNLMGKVVTEAFKETKAPKTSIKQVDDPHAAIIEAVVTEARVNKAKQRALEEGKDISRPHVLIPIVAKDVNDEEIELIKDLLYKVHSKDLGSKIAQRVIALA